MIGCLVVHLAQVPMEPRTIGKNTMAWTPENGLVSEGTGGTYGGFWPQPSNFLPIAKTSHANELFGRLF